MDLHLTKGFVAKIDAEDWPRVSQFRWHLHVSKRRGKPTNFYARSSTRKNKVYLHRFIMNCPEGKEVDHINRDGLDCRRSNLEIVEAKQNKRRRDRHRHRVLSARLFAEWVGTPGAGDIGDWL